MSSPFDNYEKRIFICYGNNAVDIFCPPDASVVNFDVFLHQHLKSLGYERILFYSHNGLYFLDKDSEFSTMGLEPVGSVMDSPLRSSQQQGNNHETGQNISFAQESQRWIYPDTSAAKIVETLKTVMTDVTPRTAVIFYTDELYGFFSNPPTPTTHTFKGMLKSDFRSLISPNRNIIIFVFGSSSYILAEQLMDKPWNFLFMLTHEGKIETIAHAIFIGSPEKDEVEKLIHHYRLTKGLKVIWNQIESIINILTAHLKSNGYMLNYLPKWLDKINFSSKHLSLQCVKEFFEISADEKSARERLDEMVGLDNIKKIVDNNIMVYKKFLNERPHTEKSDSDECNIGRFNPKWGKRHLPLNFNIHLALKGNPGTGKTTVAKLIGEIYREAGILELGHTVKVTREKLVAGYVGQTALKTKEKIEQAMGGVLFIDEAYSLIPKGEKDFASEAVEEIVEAMSDKMGYFSVIIAGYPDQIDDFIASNDGFESRFAKIQLIEDYKPELLETIFRKTCENNIPQVEIDPDLDDVLLAFFHEVYSYRENKFGNARTVQDIFRETFEKTLHDCNSEKLIMKKEHFPDTYRRYFNLIGNKPSIVKTLEKMIGLKNVKKRISELIVEKEDQLHRAKALGKDEKDIKIPPGHYVFMGNPGTGKTTVAKLMASQLKRISVLETDRVIPVKAPEIIQGLVEQTEERKIGKILKKSLGGVCLIDEAHQLKFSNYGQQILGVIVPFMEENRDKFCLIFAGYPIEMESLLSTDIGLRSRFEPPILFEDYTPEELLQIFCFMAQKEEFIITSESQNVLLNLIQIIYEHKTPHFGNARAIRLLLRMTSTRRAIRLKETFVNPTIEERLTILPIDIPSFEDVEGFI